MPDGMATPQEAERRAALQQSIRDLRRQKSLEARQFAKIRANLFVDEGGSIQRDAFMSSLRRDQVEAVELCRKAHDLHRTWFGQIAALRAAYRAANIPEPEWAVSTGAGQEKRRDTEPDVATLVRLYLSANEGRIGSFMARDVAAQWRSQALDY